VKCGQAARIDGKRLRIVAHGHRLRSVRRQVGEDGGDLASVVALRFRCAVEGCGAVMLVVPRDILPAMRYSAAAIATAFCLWGRGGRNSAARLRHRPATTDDTALSPWRHARRWLALATTGGLFALGQRLDPASPATDRALRVAGQLAGSAPPHARAGPFAAQVACGAVAVGDPDRSRARQTIRPTMPVTETAATGGSESRTA